MTDGGAAAWINDLADDEGEQRTPAPPRDVVVCGVAGGVGTSVVSALLADYRAKVGMASASWWVDLAGNDGNIVDRFGAQMGSDGVARSFGGPSLWRPPVGTTPASAVASVQTLAGVAVVDAGAHALSLTAQLDSHDLTESTPVLVIACTPDSLNRSRRILAAWQEAEILPRTVLALTSPTPGKSTPELADMALNALSHKVYAAIPFEYTTSLADGMSLLSLAAEDHDMSHSVGSLDTATQR